MIVLKRLRIVEYYVEGVIFGGDGWTGPEGVSKWGVLWLLHFEGRNPGRSSRLLWAPCLSMIADWPIKA